MSTGQTPKSPAPSPGRRRAVLAGVGGVAVLAGAGAAWWTKRKAAASEAEVSALWGLQSEQPDGSPLAMDRFRGRALLVNFWATWCPPCVDELPMIERFFRQHGGHGVQVVGLALDKPSAVRAFLTKTPVTFPIGIAGMEGTSVLRALGNTAGGLPFTLVLNSAGALHARKIGQISLQDLQGWASEFKRT